MAGLTKGFHQRAPARRLQGVLLVLAVHGLVGYALLSGLRSEPSPRPTPALPLQVIQEVQLAPPPAAPATPPRALRQPLPEPVRQPSPPQPMPQPLAAVAPAAQPAPLTPSVTAPALSVNAAPAAAPSPSVAAPAATSPKPDRHDMAVTCPVQVAPVLPLRALREDTQGVVRVQALVRDGAVQEVTFLSGPRIYYAAIRGAMLKYKCINQGQREEVVFQDFNFYLN